MILSTFLPDIFSFIFVTIMLDDPVLTFYFFSEPSHYFTLDFR